jgi:hypothetical protein
MTELHAPPAALNWYGYQVNFTPPARAVTPAIMVQVVNVARTNAG